MVFAGKKITLCNYPLILEDDNQYYPSKVELTYHYALADDLTFSIISPDIQALL